MKIAIFSSNMRIGGIQRSLYTLLNSDILPECHIDLFLFSEDDEYDLGKLPLNVNIKRLPSLPYCFHAAPFVLIKSLCRGVTTSSVGYDWTIDFDGYSQECAAYACKTKARRRAIWIHSDYVERLKYDTKFRVLFWAIRPQYDYFDKLVTVSQGVQSSILQLIGCETNRTVVIPNFVNEAELRKKSRDCLEFQIDNTRINIMYLGRLDATKNVAELVLFFSKAQARNKLLFLHIVGAGPDREALEKIVKDLGIVESVRFWGAQANPYPLMSQMDALALNSLYEGQGIVLREAQSFGLDLIFPRRLEKYNDGLSGVDNMEQAFAILEKHRKRNMDPKLGLYNNCIKKGLRDLILNGTCD